MNEVEIVVTGKDHTGPAMASVRKSVNDTMHQVTQDVGRQARVANARFVSEFNGGGGSSGGGGGNGPKLGDSLLNGFNKFPDAAGIIGAKGGTLLIAGLTGAVAGAGLIGASVGASFGAGLAGIGIAAAAQSNLVKRELADIKFSAQAQLLSISGPLEKSLLRVGDVVRTTGSNLKSYLGDAFATTAPAIDRFVKAMGTGVASLGPRLYPVARGFNAVLDSIGNKAPEIFSHLGDGIEKFANLAEQHAGDIASAFNSVTAVFEGTADALGYLAKDWDRVSGTIDRINSTPAAKPGEQWAWWGKVFGNNADMADASALAIKRVTDVAAELGNTASQAASGVGDLKAEFDELTGAALQTDDAASRYQAAMDGITESVKKNGRTIDIHTAKGRENRTALRDMAEAAQNHIAAMASEGAKVGAVSRQYTTYRAQLVSAMRSAGLTRGEATKLADAWFQMPKSVSTALHANTGQAVDAIQRVRNLMASINSKTVYMTVQQVLRTVPGVSLRQLMNAHGGIIGSGAVPQFAAGGLSGSAAGSTALVGEQGPELVKLPFGSQVIPAGQTRTMMGRQNSGYSDTSVAFKPAATQAASAVDVIKQLILALKEVITLQDAMGKLTGNVFEQERALTGYEAAWDTATKALKTNHRTLSIHTEKGRDNRANLLSLAEAAINVVSAMDKLNKSPDAIYAKMKEQRAEFIRMARSLGATAEAARDLADKYGLIPSKAKAAAVAEDKAIAKNKKIEASNKKAEAANAAAAKLAGHASGGITGGRTLVGEAGPEIVDLPYGSMVHPNGESETMASPRGGGGGEWHITLKIGDAVLGELVLDPLRKSIRTRGGDVQAVLGRR